MAGLCFAGTGVYDDHRFMSVIIGAEETETRDSRFELTRELNDIFILEN